MGDSTHCPSSLRRDVRARPTHFLLREKRAPAANSGDITRLQQGREVLLSGNQQVLHALARDFDVRLYRFDEHAHPLTREDLASMPADGRATNLVQSLLDVQQEYRDTPLAGIVVLSDGTVTAGGPPADAMAHAGIPVVTIGLGDPERYRDIQIIGVQAPSFAFVHSSVDIEVAVKSWGYEGQVIPLVLKQEGRILATSSLRLDEDRLTRRTVFTITPKEVGRYRFSVETPIQVGEALRGNNRKDFQLQVRRDKIRVLVVSGRPSWNYRFLRRALKSDPSIDLISFIILRTPTDVVNVPEDQLSLIPFPTNRLFTEELGNFDLLIFDNFAYLLYFPMLYLENVRKFVADGGAFAMFGGDQSFELGGYANTPIEEILPITLQRAGRGYVHEPVKMGLTPEGLQHPITRLASDTEETKRIWAEMPPLRGFNRARRPKPEAVTLGVAVDGQYSDLPLLATMQYGEGRTLAFLSDQLWRWNFELVGAKKGNHHYLSMMRQMVRWLVREPGLRPVQLFSDRDTYQPGDPVELRVKVLDHDFSPATGAVLNLAVKDPQGQTVRVNTLPSGEPGEFQASLRADQTGAFRVEVEARLGDKHLGEDVLIYEVTPSTAEFAYGAPDHDTLRQLAERSGGRFFQPSQVNTNFGAVLRDILKRELQYKIVEERALHLRHTPSAFLLLVVLFGAEWFLRRRAGLA
ncbi:MAG: hypothetical protein HYZ81_17665 [Nitrospinae bacterium]|nr:hypothetical protein [Nitrospinota bacterium]